MLDMFGVIEDTLAGLDYLENPPIPELSLSLSITIPSDSRVLEDLGLTKTMKQRPQRRIIDATSYAVDEFTVEVLQELVERLPILKTNLESTLKVTPTGEIVFSLEIASLDGEMLRGGRLQEAPGLE